VPLIFILVAGWLIVNTLTATPRQALAGLSIILLGLPVYGYWAYSNGTRLRTRGEMSK
jgi:APA family basic amino acid/polyamine antiporter